MKPKHLFAIFLTLFVLLVSGVEAKTRKGEKLLKAGQAAQARGDWDKALDLYEQAVDTDPGELGYLVPMRKARFEAGQVHVKAGQKLRTEGKLEEAVQEFQRALIADPSSSIALQEIKRIQEMLRAPAKIGAKADERGLSPAELSRRQSDDRVDSMLGPPELKPMTAVIPVLKMNNQPPKVLYETVAKLAGVNVVFDSQYQAPARNFNVDLSNATADQAFDYLATLTHTFWKAITPNTIFVAEDNVTKRRDYEDDVVKVFYVTNATTVQEFQEIATAIRTVAEIRRVFTYNAQRAMIVRDTVDKVALAEKLVHDLDKPKSEVVVDVMVMQVNSERTRDLAATIASAGTAGLNVPINFAPRGTTTTTTPSTSANGTPAPTTTGNTITLAQLGRLSSADFSTTLPGGLLQAMLSDSRTKVLNQPQVRASDGQKVSLKIGSRIPYATGSFGSTLGGVGAGVSPLVSTQFNYADVGVQVDMTPQVHSTDEVTLHIEVTVSSVQQYINIGGISQPIIQQSANIADIRLREGEVNILGGLSQSQDTNLVNGIPGLVNIPVLGHTIFGSDHTDKIRAEMMIALVPHIVRTPAYTAENLRGIYAGTDQVVKINYAPKDDGPIGSILAPPGGAIPMVASTVPQAPAAPAAGVTIMPGAVQVAPPAASPIAPASAAAGPPPARIMPMPMTAAATPAAAVAGPAAHVSFSPSTVQAADGATVKVNVQVENGAAMNSVAPLRIKYDPALLRLEDIAPGDIFSRGGGGATSSKDIQNDTGEASITIERLPGAPAVNGPGTLAVLTFTAIGSGQAPVTIEEVALKDSQSQPVAASTAALGVQIQ
ncbi:MAG TPA: cohesin domain-containing protein [Bryobacteraceae bacterium]|nr:cohesin domain-containing protein [Bryobacteraceae bacterium]